MNKETKSNRQPNGVLPNNRKQFFWYIIRWRFTRLLSMGLLLLLFVLPMLVLLARYDIVAATIDSENASNKLITLQLQTSLLQIFTYVFLFCGLAGILYLFRQLCWDEYASFWDGWWKGVKNGWKHFVAIGLIVGVSNAINTFAQVLFHGFVRFVPQALFVCIVLPVVLHMFTADTVYNKKFGNLLSCAAVMYFKTMPVTLLFSAGIAAVSLLLFVPNFTVRYAIFLILTVIVAPIVLLGWMLYSLDKFDVYINKDNYPDVYRKGLSRVSQDDSEKGETIR